jgi:hypothetical protein
MYAKKRRKTVELKKVTWKKRGQKRGKSGAKAGQKFHFAPIKAFHFLLYVYVLFVYF